MKKLLFLLVCAVCNLNLLAKEPSNASEVYLSKVEKSYSTCMVKTEGVTVEMLNCIATATHKLDVHLWPLKGLKPNQDIERKKFLGTSELSCKKQSAEHDGTSWSIVYAGCIYDQLAEEVRKKSRKHSIGE